MDSNSSLVHTDPAILALIRGAFDAGGGLRPFAREIMLIECQVAGTSHRDLKNIEPQLNTDAILPLRRQPDNQYDPMAIMILDEQGHHLGYVPREKNEVLARLMDAGKLLFAVLLAKEWRGDWLRIEARVLLRDL
jgi:hypothetical protein